MSTSDIPTSSDPVADPDQDQSDNPSQIPSDANNNDTTLVNLIVWALQGIMGLFQSSLIDDNGNNLNDSSPLLTPEEIDNLAMFPGNLKQFLLLQDAPLPPSKIAQMSDLLSNDSHPEWKRRCHQLLPPSTLDHPLIQILEGYRPKLRAYLGSWNAVKEHCSESIYLLDDQITVHRIPAVNHTDAVRSKLGVTEGVHAWDVTPVGPIGTHLSVGVATEKGALCSPSGYVSLIGDDAESWGWDVLWGNVSHKGKIIALYPKRIVYEYTPGDTIRLILDCDRHELSFAVNEMDFGVAAKNLPEDVPLYPTVSLVYGNVEVTLLYLGVPPPLRS